MEKYWLLKDELEDFFKQFPKAEYLEQFDQPNIRIPAEYLGKVFDFVKNHKIFPMDMLLDITAVDYLTGDYAEQPNLSGREEDLYSKTRFDVVYHFYSVKTNKRVRIITSCGGENPEVLSSYKWWQAAHFALKIAAPAGNFASAGSSGVVTVIELSEDLVAFSVKLIVDAPKASRPMITNSKLIFFMIRFLKRLMISMSKLKNSVKLPLGDGFSF